MWLKMADSRRVHKLNDGFLVCFGPREQARDERIVAPAEIVNGLCAGGVLRGIGCPRR